MNINYKNKYLKYKNKYLKAKNKLVGGSESPNYLVPQLNDTIYMPQINNVYVTTRSIGGELNTINNNFDENKTSINIYIYEYTGNDEASNEGFYTPCTSFIVELLAYKDVILSQNLVEHIINNKYKKHKTEIDSQNEEIDLQNIQIQEDNIQIQNYNIRIQNDNKKNFFKTSIINKKEKEYIKKLEYSDNLKLLQSILNQYKTKINIIDIKEYIKYYMEKFCGPEINNDNDYVFYLINLPYN